VTRRLIAFPIRVGGGRVIGGSGTQCRFYDDKALSALSTLYADDVGGTTVPNPRTPNAGFRTTLLADRLAADTFVTVTDADQFATIAVGDLIAIYDGTNTAYRVATILTTATKRIDLATALGFNFAAANTIVGNKDMTGHLQAWLDDVRDYYVQVKNVGSARVLPPILIPTKVPLTTINFQDEGVSTGAARATVNFVGSRVQALDDAGNSRVNVTIDKLLTTKGDLMTYNAGEVRKAVGADGAVVTADSAQADGLLWRALGFQPFGDGSDGNVTISADTTLTRDMFYESLTINAGKNLTPNGFRIFVRTTLTVNGAILYNGNDAAGTVGGAGRTADANATTHASPAGAGGNGFNVVSPGAGGGGAGTPNSGGQGGGGGAGGGQGGGAGGSVSSPTTANGSHPHAVPQAFWARDLAGNKIGGGSGGGSGGCNPGTGTASSGGGGGGAGVGVIFARTIVVGAAGVIICAGGNGAAAAATGNGAAGGGGGGAGGLLILGYDRLTNNGTISVGGGGNGAGAGGGAAGTAGGAGMRIDLN